MQGHQDWPLTDHGRAQATLLGHWLKARGLRWDAAYMSPLLRAQETANILHREVGGQEPFIDPDLTIRAANPALRQAGRPAATGLDHRKNSSQTSASMGSMNGRL